MTKGKSNHNSHLKDVNLCMEVMIEGQPAYNLITAANMSVRSIKEHTFHILFDQTGVAEPEGFDWNISDYDIHFEDGSNGLCMIIPLELTGALAAEIEAFAESENLLLEEAILDLITQGLTETVTEKKYAESCSNRPDWADDDFFETYGE